MLESEFREKVDEVRATFLESWSAYRDGPENPGFVADESDPLMLSDLPMVSLVHVREDAAVNGGPQHDPYVLVVDCEGNTRERTDSRLVGLPISEAAPKMGVSESALDSAVTAASNGLFHALPHVQRLDEIRSQQAEMRTQGSPRAEEKSLGEYNPNLTDTERALRRQEIHAAEKWALEHDADALQAYRHGSMGADHPSDWWKHENNLLSKYRSAVAEGYKPAAAENGVQRSRVAGASGPHPMGARLREKISSFTDRLREGRPSRGGASGEPPTVSMPPESRQAFREPPPHGLSRH